MSSWTCTPLYCRIPWSIPSGHLVFQKFPWIFKHAKFGMGKMVPKGFLEFRCIAWVRDLIWKNYLQWPEFSSTKQQMDQQSNYRLYLTSPFQGRGNAEWVLLTQILMGSTYPCILHSPREFIHYTGIGHLKQLKFFTHKIIFGLLGYLSDAKAYLMWCQS